MKAARIAILGVALAAGGVAALLASRLSTQEPETVVVEKEVGPALEVVEVLVAAVDIPMGNVVSAEDMVWRKWPKDGGAVNVVQRDARPEAMTEIAGAVARMPFVAGEPIREDKIVRTDGSGFMSAILPSGQRAISTEISAETAAGGFILPNDHVDVILTRRDSQAEQQGRQVFLSETILGNVRVLAIDQQIEDKDGKRVVVGRTATLALAPEQAEVLALARQLGTLHLALRSLTDSRPGSETVVGDPLKGRKQSGITVVRYGVATEAQQ